jgi:NADPH:quinone reductase-like Zn-dependent oxidoreductase
METALHLLTAIIWKDTMRAFVVSDFENPPSLADIPTPEPGTGEVLVRVRSSSLNGYDLATAAGLLKGMMEYRFPVVLGKDYAGTIAAVGADATRFAVGDPVFGVVMKAYPGDGAFGEYVAVPESYAVTRIPEGLDVNSAGALGLAGAAALDVVDAVVPSAGETVLISGATGGVGAFAVQLAAARGATVIGTAKPGEDTAFVRDLGAAHVVDYAGDLAAHVRAIRPGGVDAVIHLAGDGPALADLLAPGGRFASTLGVGPDQLGGRDVHATAVFANPDAARLDRLAADVVAGRLRVPIQQTYQLDELRQAMVDFAAGTRGKLAVFVS